MTKQVACPVCGGRGYVLWVNTTDSSHSTGSKTCPHCDGTGLREVELTNADRIRAMSDEELADFITNCGCYDHSRDCRASCKDCTMKWLKQPVEVE